MCFLIHFPNSFIEILFLLFFSLLLDWPLQGEFIATNKGKYPLVMIVHCFIWSVGIFIAGVVFNILDIRYVGLYLIILFPLHYLVDYWKCTGLYKASGMPDSEALAADQLVHVFQVVMCIVVTALIP